MKLKIKAANTLYSKDKEAAIESIYVIINLIRKGATVVKTVYQYNGQKLSAENVDFDYDITNGNDFRLFHSAELPLSSSLLSTTLFEKSGYCGFEIWIGTGQFVQLYFKKSLSSKIKKFVSDYMQE